MRYRFPYWGALAFAALSFTAARADESTRSKTVLNENLGVLEQEVHLACNGDGEGQSRASLAYMAYSKANSLLEKLDREMEQIHQFLESPQELAERQIQQDLVKARTKNRTIAKAALNDEVYALEYLQIRARQGFATEQAVDAQRDRVRTAKRKVDFYERSDALREQIFPPDQVRQLTSLKVKDALSRLSDLSDAGQRLDHYSRKARGCWAVATGKARPAAPGIQGSGDPGFAMQNSGDPVTGGAR